MDAPLALVAGASRGLGLLIATELLRRGHRVAICARDRTQVDAAVERLSAEGTVSGHVCDVADREQVARLVAEVEAEHGPVEVLVSVAGVIQVGPAESMTLEHFEEAIGIMLWGPVHLAWAVLPGMRERGRGRIANICSIGGVVAPPHLLPYATAKFGAVGFSEGLTAELAGTGITVTTVVPGLMRTGAHEVAEFTGQTGREYAWLATSDSLPLISMDAGRAARRIVDGLLRGRTRVTLTPLAQVATRVKGLAPATTTVLLGVANLLLPDAPADGTQETVPGHVAAKRLGSKVVGALTVLGSAAARGLNTRTGRR
ncbi:SDR family NAD(P)-dependent oxidoreductase [Auraticoccus sp. F435]|uniref:SDR family NAD(P)-dependent oxidoreductase n=1 Tax=Auraticoccus cholistanensis TaxID=2656650 RepID=A0A6A9UTD1_9ACTN|nr:SDR family oxidoreductase [Auraticoccus cholistanensis]MVA76186.1 SDR family NAD(P)-dependent oxidoreductase [Auraticoccus cholistanensis]